MVQTEQPMRLATSRIESGSPNGSGNSPDSAFSHIGQCCGQQRGQF
jgi:hypothetical protein